MAMTFIIENINNDITLCLSERSEIPPSGSYYKFYQSKLRQLITQTRYRREQEARIARQKQSKNPLNDNRLSEQRLHKEYMDHIRSKIQSQEILPNEIVDQRKRPESVMSNQTTTLGITSTTISAPIESRRKPILRTKQTSVSPSKQQRIISAPTSYQGNLNKPKTMIPTIKIDCFDENLSKANIHSFTQVSSSSQNHNNQTYQHARKSILDTIILHLDSHMPTNASKCPTYEDIDNKFSSSIAPTVYQNFERIVD